MIENAVGFIIKTVRLTINIIYRNTESEQMKLRSIVFCAAALNLAACAADMVHMPSKEVLEQRLKAAGFQHFGEKSQQFLKQLAGQELSPIGVVMLVEAAIMDYTNYLDPVTATTIDMRKPALFAALLKENPETLQELRDLGLVK